MSTGRAGRVGFIATYALMACGVSGAADQPSASLKTAVIVTEVLEWGETVTALRLEYSDEIDSSAIDYTNEPPGKMTYRIVNDRSVANVYVNDSGKKDDVELHGKYVFINLTVKNADYTTYRDQVTFNTASKYRDKLSAFYGFQVEPIVTRSGAVIAPGRFVTTGEMSLGVDEFQTFAYKNDSTGRTLYYHLFVPRGFEAGTRAAAKAPLVVHFPSSDYAYTDFRGGYRGALYTHPDALYWISSEAQAAAPAFVVTIGGTIDPSWREEFSKSAMQQDYLNIVRKIAAEYRVDASRIYAISLAGGSIPMWSTLVANPHVFAGQITTALDPYEAYGAGRPAEDKFLALLKTAPGWFFTGFTDGSGGGNLDPLDTRTKGERLRDAAMIENARGMTIDVGYGKDGELMWNGLLRGEKAERLARVQWDRAKSIHAKHLVTLYMPGTLPQSMHWSWNATYSNSVVREWLFQQVNATPAVGLH